MCLRRFKLGAQYKLRGVVRYRNNHFTCAVKDRNTCTWTYFDDLSIKFAKVFKLTVITRSLQRWVVLHYLSAEGNGNPMRKK